MLQIRWEAGLKCRYHSLFTQTFPKHVEDRSQAEMGKTEANRINRDKQGQDQCKLAEGLNTRSQVHKQRLSKMDNTQNTLQQKTDSKEFK